jgi:hypothetical protein
VLELQVAFASPSEHAAARRRGSRRHIHIALTGEIDLVLCSLDLPVAQAIGFVDAALNLLLHGERHLERDGGDGLDEQIADGGVDRGADDGLAERIAGEAAANLRRQQSGRPANPRRQSALPQRRRMRS